MSEMNFEYRDRDDRATYAGRVDQWELFCESVQRRFSVGAAIQQAQWLCINGFSYALAELKAEMSSVETDNEGWAQVLGILEKSGEAKGIVRCAAPEVKFEKDAIALNVNPPAAFAGRKKKAPEEPIPEKVLE
jgi:hypothetical protein